MHLPPALNQTVGFPGRVKLPGGGVAEFLRVFSRKQLQLFGLRHVHDLAGTQLFGQPLRQDAEQRVGKVKGVHTHVQQPCD